MRQIDLLDKTKSKRKNPSTGMLKTTNNIVCKIPIFKNGDSHYMAHFSAIRVLPATAKIYDRILKNTISPLFEDKFSTILFGFRERHSTEHALKR